MAMSSDRRAINSLFDWRSCLDIKKHYHKQDSNHDDCS